MGHAVRSQRGLTLIEVLIASVIAAVTAGGAATAIVAAARMMRAPSNPGTAEASGYARETAERFRTRMACDDPWFDAACQPTNLSGGWSSDPLPAPAAGVDSILTTGARRCYQVTSQDCDGVGGAGDCVAIEVRLCWNDGDANWFANCPC